jgi:cupin superfamily acireductone dioxygenase involved in methionine salvage
MKSILYSVCIGTLALALTAGGTQAAMDKNKRQERAKPQQRSANVQAARPANTGRTMSAQRNVSAAQYRQRAMTQRTGSNFVANRNARLQSMRERNFATNQAFRERTNAAFNRNRNVAVDRMRNFNANREQNATVNRARNFDANRERSVTVNRTRNADLNRFRNANEFRNRDNIAINRDRNVAVNRTRNADVNRLRNTNEFRNRDNVAINRDRDFNRAQNADVNRFRNADEFRGRNNVAINRNRNFTVNRTQTAAFYRGGNVRITNNWRGDAFRGQRYAAFRNYNRQWHDRSWWRSHYDRIIFVNNGWWYWNAGYWFPAWGFAPSVSYVYDGPIYGYNGLSPDQVTVNVQEALAAAGYYDGPIDGVLGPMTREAIAAYQADNGLAVTSAIDEPTLATMGLV